VYRAHRLKDGLSYVIKTIKIGELTHAEQLEAINEVKLLASIQSLYVVKYFDSFVENETLYIVMEYCNRGDLKGLLKRRKSKVSKSFYILLLYILLFISSSSSTYTKTPLTRRLPTPPPLEGHSSRVKSLLVLDASDDAGPLRHSLPEGAAQVRIGGERARGVMR
jgi:serine/threonine protein kinase